MRISLSESTLRPFRGLFLFLFLLLLTGIIACDGDRMSMPKPRAFPRIVFPEKAYQPYENPDCPYQFSYPVYARIVKDSIFFDEKAQNECWFNVELPEFNGTIHCTYYAIEGKDQLESLIFDSFTLVNKHTIKAQYIEETPIRLREGGGGMRFRISGPVASPTQFFLTDSTHHFLRGSLYFHNQIRLDSMSVVYDFVNEDIDRLLESFSWTGR